MASQTRRENLSARCLELDPNQWHYSGAPPAKVRADKAKAQFAIDRSAAAAKPMATYPSYG
jgi:hypothetical protein